MRKPCHVWAGVMLCASENCPTASFALQRVARRGFSFQDRAADAKTSDKNGQGKSAFFVAGGGFWSPKIDARYFFELKVARSTDVRGRFYRQFSQQNRPAASFALLLVVRRAFSSQEGLAGGRRGLGSQSMQRLLKSRQVPKENQFFSFSHYWGGPNIDTRYSFDIEVPRGRRTRGVRNGAVFTGNSPSKIVICTPTRCQACVFISGGSCGWAAGFRQSEHAEASEKSPSVKENQFFLFLIFGEVQTLIHVILLTSKCRAVDGRAACKNVPFLPAILPAKSSFALLLVVRRAFSSQEGLAGGRRGLGSQSMQRLLKSRQVPKENQFFSFSHYWGGPNIDTRYSFDMEVPRGRRTRGVQKRAVCTGNSPSKIVVCTPTRCQACVFISGGACGCAAGFRQSEHAEASEKSASAQGKSVFFFFSLLGRSKH